MPRKKVIGKIRSKRLQRARYLDLRNRKVGVRGTARLANKEF
jgi:hypothetical protein